MVADGNASRQSTEDFPSGGRFADQPATVAIGLRVRELIEFASYYLTAQADRVRLTVVNVAMFAVLGAVAALVGVAVVLTAGVLLVVGIAQALGVLFDHIMWLGNLVTAVVILGGLIAATIFVFKKVTKSSRERLVAAYEQRKHKQRTTLGTDVEEQAQR